MNFVCHNGNFFPADAALLTIQNRGFKYGDGVFETMKVTNGKLPLAALHFERLFLSLRVLQMDKPAEVNEESLLKNIFQLCERNNCSTLARVRLSVYRNEKNESEYAIEATQLNRDVNKLNEEGLVVDIFPYARKSCDAYSNLKTANFLPYVLADLYAKGKILDDCIILNSENNICDTSKANIFLIKDQELFTPALHQGCVNGVMRRFVIERTKQIGYPVHQKEIKEIDLLNADEVFLTNAVFGMRWVKSFREKNYSRLDCSDIYEKIIQPINN